MSRFSTPESRLVVSRNTCEHDRIWWPPSAMGGITITAQSDETAVWHDRRKPSRTSSCPSWTVSMMVGGGTLPLTILMRQLWHRPRPPHVAITSIPASCAALRNVCPGVTGIVRPTGSKVTARVRPIRRRLS